MPNASEAISERTKAALAAAKAPGKRLSTPAQPSRSGKTHAGGAARPRAQFAAIGLPMGLSGPVSMPQGAKTLAPAFVSVLRKWARVSPAISTVAIVAERAFAA